MMATETAVAKATVPATKAQLQARRTALLNQLDDTRKELAKATSLLSEDKIAAVMESRKPSKTLVKAVADHEVQIGELEEEISLHNKAIGRISETHLAQRDEIIHANRQKLAAAVKPQAEALRRAIQAVRDSTAEWTHAINRIENAAVKADGFGNRLGEIRLTDLIWREFIESDPGSRIVRLLEMEIVNAALGILAQDLQHGRYQP